MDKELMDLASELECEELASDVRFFRAYQIRLLSSPNCNDPDHPGCLNCLEDE